MNGIYAVNRKPGRLWAILQFPVTRFVIAIFALMCVLLPAHLSVKAFHISPRSLTDVLASMITAVLVIVVYCFYVRVIENRPVSEYALPASAGHFGCGFLVGMMLFGCIILILWLLGVAHISKGSNWFTFGYQFILAGILPAVIEETMTRGVLFRIVEESLGSWLALAISAAVFGGMHAFNPGATLESSVAIALEAGVLLAAIYMYSRRLWMPIGLHAAWNFTEAGVFGASVSDNREYGLLRCTFTGPDWLTGGKFGVEGSVITIMVCLVAGIVFLGLANKRNYIAPPIWVRRKAGV